MRKTEITNTLDYLCQQLGELEVSTILPDDIERREVVINRAIDVRTACMHTWDRTFVMIQLVWG